MVKRPEDEAISLFSPGFRFYGGSGPRKTLRRDHMKNLYMIAHFIMQGKEGVGHNSIIQDILATIA